MAAAVANFDHRRTRRLAERIIGVPRDPATVGYVAATGDYQSALRLARRLPRDQRVQALCTVAITAENAGHSDCAQRIAEETGPPEDRARIHTAVSTTATDQAQARRWAAKALATGRWPIALPALSRTDPDALLVLVRHLVSPDTPG